MRVCGLACGECAEGKLGGVRYSLFTPLYPVKFGAATWPVAYAHTNGSVLLCVYLCKCPCSLGIALAKALM